MRRCRFDKTRRCFHDGHCDTIDSLGVVSVCPLYRGGDKFRPRRVESSPVSIFVLWKRRGKSGGRGS